MISDPFPLVSIIITSYNRAEFIGQAIESALAQTYPNLQILIVDNCSTDNSNAVIKEYEFDKRINYIRNNSNIGMILNFQKGIELASGEYLTFISSDDYFINQGFISESVHLSKKYDNIVFVKGGSVYFHNDTSQLGDYDYSNFNKEIRSGKEMFMEFQKRSSPMGFDAILINNKKFKSLDICYDPSMILLDNEINLKLCLLGDVGFINKPSYAFRMHPNQATKTYGNEILQGNMAIVDRAKEMALQKKIFKKTDLDNWYNSVQQSTLRYNYIKKYIQSFDEHTKFEKKFNPIYPIHFHKIRKEFKIRLLKLFYNRKYNLMWLLKVIAPNYHTKVSRLKNNLN